MHELSLYCVITLLLYLQDCIICMDQLSNPSGYETPSPEEGGQSIQPGTVGKFIKCGHTLHMLCMLAMYNNGTKVRDFEPATVSQTIVDSSEAKDGKMPPDSERL